MYYISHYKSPVGLLTLAGEGEHLTGLWLEGQKYFGATLPRQSLERDIDPVFIKAREWLDRYFAGERPGIGELSLAPSGGVFRQEVWRLLCEIPYGEVTTYGEIARRLAKRLGRSSTSAQAIGGAVGHNPISIVIPCHRVVGAGGSLTGYAGGVEKKRWLLAHEGVDVSRLMVPTRGTAL